MLLPVTCFVHLPQQPFTKRCVLVEWVLGVREVDRVFDLISVVRWVCAHVRPDFGGRVRKNRKLALLHVETLTLADVVVRTDRDLQLTDCVTATQDHSAVACMMEVSIPVIRTRVIGVMNCINFTSEYIVIPADEVAFIGSVNSQG